MWALLTGATRTKHPHTVSRPELHSHRRQWMVGFWARALCCLILPPATCCPIHQHRSALTGSERGASPRKIESILYTVLSRIKNRGILRSSRCCCYPNRTCCIRSIPFTVSVATSFLYLRAFFPCLIFSKLIRAVQYWNNLANFPDIFSQIFNV